MSDWQPIKTAPKDGTRILMLTKGGPTPRVMAWEQTAWCDDGGYWLTDGDCLGWTPLTL